MNETESYDAIRPRLQALKLDPQRVENVLNHGTPDVWYTRGAIENKYMAAWPKRSETPVDIGLLPEQATWLYRRWVSGGPSWVMLRVDKRYMLFAGVDAPAIRAMPIREDLESLAVWATAEKGRGDWADLGNWLLWKSVSMTITQQARYLRLRAARSRHSVASSMGVEVSYVVDGETWSATHANDLIDYWLA